MAKAHSTTTSMNWKSESEAWPCIGGPMQQAQATVSRGPTAKGERIDSFEFHRDAAVYRYLPRQIDGKNYWVLETMSDDEARAAIAPK